MNWVDLIEEQQLAQIIRQSSEKPVVIFKHSTQCGRSSRVKNKLENAVPPPGILFYYLDLLAFRRLSQKIAEDFGIIHQSPQILIIKNGVCIYDEDHDDINMDEIVTEVAMP